jgi:hypothetical protein
LYKLVLEKEESVEILGKIIANKFFLKLNVDLVIDLFIQNKYNYIKLMNTLNNNDNIK